MLVTCKNIGRAFIYWLRNHSTLEERTTICELLACEGGGDPDCVPNWQDSGSPTCINFELHQPQSDGCGNTRIVNTHDYCEGECEPLMVATSTYRCHEGRYERLWRDRCDYENTEWEDLGPVAWTPVVPAETTCGPNSFELVKEESQCGETRWTETATPCGAPCTPVFIDTGVFVCENGGYYAIQESTNCGTTLTRKERIGDVFWTLQTDRDCIGGVPHALYTNQCGEEDWRPIDREWVDVVPAEYRCNTSCTDHESGCYQKLQVDTICPGVTRWVTIGPITWADTSPAQIVCMDGIEHKLQHNICGTATRWVPTTDPGTPCSDLWDAPPSEGLYAVTRSYTHNAQAELTFIVKANGEWEIAGQVQPGSYPRLSGSPTSGKWHAAAANPSLGAGYEVKFTPNITKTNLYTGLDSSSVTPSAPTAWQSLSTGRQFKLDTGNLLGGGADSGSMELAGTYEVRIRQVGDSGNGEAVTLTVRAFADIGPND